MVKCLQKRESIIDTQLFVPRIPPTAKVTYSCKLRPALHLEVWAPPYVKEQILGVQWRCGEGPTGEGKMFSRWFWTVPSTMHLSDIENHMRIAKNLTQ